MHHRPAGCRVLAVNVGFELRGGLAHDRLRHEDAPRAFVPQPVMGKTAAELKAYVYGKDPITGRPVMQEVIAGLTTALNG